MTYSYELLAKTAPKLPGITCPVIDDALDDLSDAIGLIDYLPMDVATTARTILDELRGDEGKIEQIRAANEQLRSAALFWKREARKMAERIADLESKANWTHVIR